MKRAEFLFWMSLILVVAALTFWKTADRVNWLLDAGWVVVGWPLLAVTRTSFTLTPLLYRLLAIHALVLMSGGMLDLRADSDRLVAAGRISDKAQPFRPLWPFYAGLRARPRVSRDLRALFRSPQWALAELFCVRQLPGLQRRV